MPRSRAGLLALTTLIALAGCGEGGARNVVVVVVDTLRADHLGCYGYSRPVSPHIDAFAESSTLYERATSSAPWTVPSHASLFTGLDPFEHGAYSFPAGPGQLRNVHPLAAEHETLAEALAGEGFATAAFVANAGFLHRSLQLDQGFEVYQPERAPGEVLNTRVLDWLEAHHRKPFFLFVNYMDAHWPYNTQPRPGQVEPPASIERGLAEELFQAVMPGKRMAPSDLAERVIAQYDTGVAHADEAVGALLARLRTLGVFDDTVIVVTSDHGEYFGEHRLVGHSKDVYQPALHVPLLVKGAEQHQGSRTDMPVSSAQVAHLVVEALGAPAAERLARRFPRAPGSPVVAENHYSRARDMLNPAFSARFQRVRRVLYDWPLKYVSSSDGDHELYDLVADPDERRNLIEIRAADASRLRDALAAHEASTASPEAGARAPAPSAEELEVLRELGYVE